jgi:hypothetical protein
VSRLWSTHNGGKTWQQVRLDPLSLTYGVIQMATHGKWTYLFGGSVTTSREYLLGTRSNVDQWSSKSSAEMGMPAGGTQLVGSFTFAGGNGWFVAGNDRGFTANARLLPDGSWGAWNGPSFESFGSSSTPIDAVTNRVLLAEGQSAGIVYPPASSVPSGWNNGASWLFISYDAGATFKPLRKISSTYQGSYYSIVPGLPATPVPGTILHQQASNSSYHMVRSTNWGRTWSVVLDDSVSQVLFTSRTIGFAIAKERSSQATFSVFRTIDAGRYWNKVSL